VACRQSRGGHFRDVTRTPAIDAEHIGLNLLARFTDVFPVFAAKHEDLTRFMRAQLEVGAAVNALNTKRIVDAIELYAAATRDQLHLNFDGTARALVGRIADLTGRIGENQASPPAAGETSDDPFFRALLAVIGISGAVEDQLGAPGSDLMQSAYRRFFVGLTRANSAPISALMQFAKGARFSSSIKHPTRLHWADDPVLMALAPEITLLESTHVAADAAAPAGTLEEELEFLSHGADPTPVDGEQATEHLFNLRRSFNQRLDEIATRADRKDVFLDPGDLAAQLPARTVLMDLFLADYDENRQSLLSMVYTRDEIRIFQNVIPEERALASAQLHGRKVYLTGPSLMVALLREQVQRFSGPRPIDPEVEESLRLHPDGLLGASLLEYLDELRAKGKDHLCICPNQGLRYYPLHLLAPGGRYLADDWIVTYLPSLQCLQRERSEARRQSDLSVLAMTFAGAKPFPFPELKMAEDEARRIAEAFETTPLLDQQVTEDAILRALASSRYVHLCTHGQHHAAAPVFQTVFATPTDASDGRLRAYELLGVDLRGLELVTLAACDSALGHFDISDNLTGLPAALLLAGAQTIVGSMWRANDRASRRFFVELYAALRRGEGRLDAFRHAQNEVRAAFPAVRHWAAFCLMGTW
jgi:hypothetical protein